VGAAVERGVEDRQLGRGECLAPRPPGRTGSQRRPLADPQRVVAPRGKAARYHRVRLLEQHLRSLRHGWSVHDFQRVRGRAVGADESGPGAQARVNDRVSATNSDERHGRTRFPSDGTATTARTVASTSPGTATASWAQAAASPSSNSRRTS
jgi:hypothetical protein